MIRRVVTGHQGETAVFTSDGLAPKGHVFESLPGLGQALAWVTPHNPIVGADDFGETVTARSSYFPEAGGSTLLYMQIPPQAQLFSGANDPARIAAEFAEHAPDTAATMDPDNPNMHRTDTIDYVIVLEGEIYLELDAGEEKLLRAHDFVVQRGTRHAWHNRTDQTVTLAIVLIGATRV